MSDLEIKVLVVDDSALYRKFVASVLEQIPGVDVVGTATNGRIGLEKIKALKPDLVTLDQEMPELDGLGVLRALSQQNIHVASIMISSLTEAGAKTTNSALRLGAFDFVLKPVGKDPESSRAQLRADLTPKVKAFLSTHQRKATQAKQPEPSASEMLTRSGLLDSSSSKEFKRPRIVGIGISTGGPVALSKMLPKIPANFPCPILIVQHMPPKFTKSLADDLNRTCQIEVLEGGEGMRPRAGQALIAPGGKQMRITRVGKETVVQITDDPAERNCKPAVDYLFRSIAHCYGEYSLGAILTGMGDDGTLGCKLLKRTGAKIITQDEASCVVYGMPRSVVEAGLSDEVAPLNQIAECLSESVGIGAIA